jgi:class 3 adenylate cyclase
MFVRILFVVTSILWYFDVQAQTKAEQVHSIDSMLLILNSAAVTSDTQWIRMLEDIMYSRMPFEKRGELTPYLFKALDKARSTKEPSWKIRAFLRLTAHPNLTIEENEQYADSIMALLPGIQKTTLRMYQAANMAEQVYYQNRKYVKCILAIKEWNRLAALANNSAGLYHNEAYVYREMGRYDLAKKILLDELAIIPNHDSMLLTKSFAYLNLASVYNKEKKLDSCIVFSQRGIQLMRAFNRIKKNQDGNLEINFRSLADYFLNAGQPDSAVYYLNVAAEFCSKKPKPSSDFRGLWCNYTKVYLFKKDYDRALTYLKLAEDHYNTYGGIRYVFNFFELYGQCYSKRGNRKIAIKYFEKAYAEGLKDVEFLIGNGELIAVCDSLSHLYEKTGDYKQSIQYLKIGQKYRQKLLEETSLKDIAKYELAQNEAEKSILKQQNTQQTQKTYAAVLGVIIALGVLAFAIYLLRQRRKLFKELDIEKQRSEALLLNILPANIAMRLKNDPRAIADAFEEATVIFIDIVGFTTLSAQHTPHEIVRLLNEVFVWFDQLTGRLGLEKIKTIGDCYMAVSGLPNYKADHLTSCIEMGLTILQDPGRFRFFGQQIQFRIGIDTGPVVAGIIGEKRFLYDLWGDVVNTASRMESNGLPDTIQITERVYEKVKDQYKFQERGLVEIKGKGKMKTWLIAPEK